MLILSPEEIRNAENEANKAGLSFEDMMESAGAGCAEHIIKNYPDAKKTVIICGKGKNGGDGFVIARYLKECKKDVNVLLAFSSPSDELSEKNKKKLEGSVDILTATHVTKSIMSVINEADIIVDAVFGIGFKGELPENIKELFAISNHSSAVKIAVDIPSGLCTDSEKREGCFKADETLSMLCYKKEHVFKPFSNLCGKVSVIPIGFALISDNPEAKTAAEIKAMLPYRPFDANKGTFGKALLIAGSYKTPGAGIITAKGSLSSGTGLTFFAFPESIYSTVTAHLTESVFRPLSSDENGDFSESAFSEIKDELSLFDAVAIGPGIGTSKGAESLVINIIKYCKGKIIIDADGINILSRNIDILKESNADIILTPHPGEMSRLTGIDTKTINSDRINTAKSFAREYGVNVLLKGANTVIASPEGRVFINPTGSSALARGGSGDLLTGIILAMCSQGLDTLEAGVVSSYIHGLSGDIAEKKYTPYSATIHRITSCIPKALSKIISGK